MSDDDDPEKPKRVVGRPFQKGTSGNPGGKPKSMGPTFLPPTTSTPEEIERRITGVACKALALLEAVIDDESCETRDRITAARAALDKVKPNASPAPPPDPEEEKRKKELEDFVSAMRAKPPAAKSAAAAAAAESAESDGDVSS